MTTAVRAGTPVAEWFRFADRECGTHRGGRQRRSEVGGAAVEQSGARHAPGCERRDLQDEHRTYCHSEATRNEPSSFAKNSEPRGQHAATGTTAVAQCCRERTMSVVPSAQRIVLHWKRRQQKVFTRLGWKWVNQKTSMRCFSTRRSWRGLEVVVGPASRRRPTAGAELPFENDANSREEDKNGGTSRSTATRIGSWASGTPALRKPSGGKQA